MVRSAPYFLPCLLLAAATACPRFDARRSEGSPPAGADHRPTSLYPVDPARVRTMMQPCASAAGLRGGGPILQRGLEAIGTLGSPPPRIVISGPPDDRWAGRETVFGGPASTGPSRRRA